jgi:hypothetical protein
MQALEQHVLAFVQGSPTGAHAHVPEMQLLLQQSAGDVQATPTPEQHVPEAHSAALNGTAGFCQQSLSYVQAVPGRPMHS